MAVITQKELEQYGSLELLAKQVVEGFITGLHKSPFHGFSVEFAEHRLYNKGESTRHIDWKLFARTEKLFVKRYEEETNLRCQIVIDTSSSMYYPEEGMSKIRFSIYAAAVLMSLLRQQRDAFGLSLFAQELEFHSQCKSSTVHHQLMLAQLEQLLLKEKLNRNTSLANALTAVADQIHRRSLVVVFSDMFQAGQNSEELFRALQRLKFSKNEVILFHVNDGKHELNFEFENRPYIFIDKETGQEVKLQPHEVKDAYLAQVNDYMMQLRQRCAQYRIEFVEADVNKDFMQILIPFFVKRSKMF
ncbi:MAG: DUF58 domain-containing protein [Bacteroidetes bacterium]|nr:MAG: DUF58 domain-containing protein [Bacteroidota bacterium]